jgi:hypothetical protein
MMTDDADIEKILADFELAEYLCFLLEYIEALLQGYARDDDAIYCFDEKYVPDHPVMRLALDIYTHH